MATFDLPELPESRVSPQLMLGAASPLWAYFGAAAAGGVAYWWMTRWTRPVNLEAMLGGPTPTPAPMIEAVAQPGPAVEAAVDEAQAVAQAADDAVAATSEGMAEAAAETDSEALPAAPVGGEAAPVSPLIEVLGSPETESEPVLEALEPA